jgi:hypothetical protein
MFLPDGQERRGFNITKYFLTNGLNFGSSVG